MTPKSNSLPRAWSIASLALPAIALAAAALSGCAGSQAFREGQGQIAQGQNEAGLAKLREAMEKEPSNNEYRRTYFTQREANLNRLLRDAEIALEVGDFAASRAAFAKGTAIDPGNERASAGAARVDAAERHWKALEGAVELARGGSLTAAVAQAQQVLSEDPNHRRGRQMLRALMRQQADASGKDLGLYPKLKPSYNLPVSLSFNNASLLQVFEALKQASGLNFVIDRDVRPELRVTLSVTGKPVDDIVRLLLATNQLERRVLDSDTLLIYPNTPAKAAEYREMVVRSFFLGNADATKVANVVRTIAKARDVVVDEKLNMLMVRDSAEVIRLVEKVIASQDLPEPEVMLELEVLEVSANRLLDIGIQWPDSVSASVIGANGVGQLTVNELRNRSSDLLRLRINDPVLSAQFRSQKGDANLLANPRVRVRNKQSAKILIGERVPVITTTSTANVGNSESVSYLDVGLKLDIEPTVSLDDEVSMKIALEVSNILETVIRGSGTQAYRLGTRNTSTSLRVRDGETNILAGLIQRDERRSNTGIPGLNEAPLVSRLFGKGQDSDNRTEIVLLITPRIVRNLDVPSAGLLEFLSGTDAANGAAPIQLGVPAGAGTAPPAAAATPAFLPPAVPGAAPPGPAMAPALATPSAPPALVAPPIVPSAPDAR